MDLQLVEGGLPTRDIKRLNRAASYSAMAKYLEDLLAEAWMPGARTSAYDAQGYEVQPESKRAAWFSISGACRALFQPNRAADFAMYLGFINDMVFNVPITHRWEAESGRTFADIQRLLRAAVIASKHPQISRVLREPGTDQDEALRVKVVSEIKQEISGATLKAAA